MRHLLTYLRLGWRRPKHFFPSLGEVHVGPDVITVRDYPFAPSLAFRQNPRAAAFAPADVTSVTLETQPLLHVGHDFVLLERERAAALQVFAKAHQLPVRPHRHAWDFLLDPFLDTETTPEQDERLYLRLAEYGLPRAEVDALRAEVHAPMMYYNFGLRLWAWEGFGLRDVLSVMRVHYGPVAFADFYRRAMEVEGRQG